MAGNLFFSGIKIVGGIFGQSQALIADGIESLTDLIASAVVFIGLKISARPPDAEHPYGHGKAESIAALIAASSLLFSSLLIATTSFQEIRSPHSSPAPWTLLVLGLVIGGKEYLSRRLIRGGIITGSQAIQVDAWHHRSDAITSAAVFLGICLALLGGEAWAVADDWAALVICVFMVVNAVLLMRPSLHEIMDGEVDASIHTQIGSISRSVEGVKGVETIRVRKSGLQYFVDLHIEVDGQMSVDDGHIVAHKVKAALIQTTELRILDVLVHIEPWEE
jgi:cation diffusion facilitator family transporter